MPPGSLTVQPGTLNTINHSAMHAVSRHDDDVAPPLPEPNIALPPFTCLGVQVASYVGEMTAGCKSSRCSSRSAANQLSHPSQLCLADHQFDQLINLCSGRSENNCNGVCLP